VGTDPHAPILVQGQAIDLITFQVGILKGFDLEIAFIQYIESLFGTDPEMIFRILGHTRDVIIRQQAGVQHIGSKAGHMVGVVPAKSIQRSEPNITIFVLKYPLDGVGGQLVHVRESFESHLNLSGCTGPIQDRHHQHDENEMDLLHTSKLGTNICKNTLKALNMQ
jgi:hypothetical protein